ncbi:MAG: hypothetical protein WAL92_06685 [Thiogranum sp.]|jgi:hypothetical protein
MNTKSTEEVIMENGNGKVEVIVHVNEALDETRRSELTMALEQNNGIYSAEFCPLRYHLMLVGYDKERVSSQDVLGLVKREHVAAQLIGPI